MIKSKIKTDHKMIKDVHEESLQNPRQKQPVPMQPSRRAFKCVQTPCSVLQINIEDVWTSKQHRTDDRSISIQQGVCFQKSTLFGKSLQAVRTMSNSSKYSRVPFERGKDFSEDRSDVNPIKIKLRCFWKDIAENRPDVANFRLDACQPESESQQFFRSLETYK
jgi:hypothetical protein